MEPTLGTRRLKAIGISLLVYGLLFIGPQLVVGSGVSFLGVIFSMASNPDIMSGMENVTAVIPNWLMQLALCISDGITVILCAIFIPMLYKQRLPRFMGLTRQSAGRILLHVLLAFCVVQAVQLYMTLIPESWTASYAEAASSLEADDTVGGVIISALATVVAAPIAEEFIFRGFVFNRLRADFPFWAAMLMSSLLFGVTHGHPVWIVYAFTLGCVLCLIMEKYRSLTLCIVVHMAFNLFGSYLDLIPMSDTAAWIVMILGVAGCAAFAVTSIIRASIRKAERNEDANAL